MRVVVVVPTLCCLLPQPGPSVLATSLGAVLAEQGKQTGNCLLCACAVVLAVPLEQSRIDTHTERHRFAF